MMNEKHISDVVNEINKMKQNGMSDGAFTTRQLIEQTGYSRDKANRLLLEALELGLCVYDSDRIMQNRCGRDQKIPHYRWVTPKRKDKKK